MTLTHRRTVATVVTALTPGDRFRDEACMWHVVDTVSEPYMWRGTSIVTVTTSTGRVLHATPDTVVPVSL